jgi:hypothetical protein
MPPARSSTEPLSTTSVQHENDSPRIVDNGRLEDKKFSLNPIDDHGVDRLTRRVGTWFRFNNR